MSKIEIKLDELKKLLYNAHMAGQGVEKGVAWELAEKYAEQQVKKLGLPVVTGSTCRHIVDENKAATLGIYECGLCGEPMPELQVGG